MRSFYSNLFFFFFFFFFFNDTATTEIYTLSLHDALPIFSSTPARMTEPAVGASTCASGSQVCTGHIGTLTANDAKNARNSQVCIPTGIGVFICRVISVLQARNYTARHASSLRLEPANADRKNVQPE